MRSAYRAVNSCLMLLPMADSREILTVEALGSDGHLTAGQRAMAAAGGSQCGYCTPGFVVSLFAEEYRPDRKGLCDSMALAGNLCRCTGYRPIRDAAESLGPAPEDRFSKRLERTAPVLRRMSTAGFSRPSSIEECVALLRDDPHAKLVAGATDVAVESNLHFTRWPHLVSIEAIEELREFSDTPSAVRIGAGLPLSDIGRRWLDAPAAVREWLTLFASPLIRNRATLGGNLATASPIGDAAPLLLALDASVQLAGGDGTRAIPISTFFTGYRKTVMRAGELIVAIEIPKPLPAFVRFYKVAKRKLDDISTVAAAIALDVDGQRRVRRARIAYGGVAATPIRVEAVEALLVDQLFNETTVERAQSVLDTSINPLSDHRGSREFRREVSKSLLDKCRWEYAL